MSDERGPIPAVRIWALVAGAAALQTATWLAVRWMGYLSGTAGTAIQLVIGWTAILVLAVIATSRIGGLTRRLTQHETAHLATLDLVGQLETQNTLLKTLAQSNDVGRGFQSLARHIVRLIDCDRLGLALLREDGQRIQTFTARVNEEERRIRPRPELEFNLDRTLMGDVLKAREPFVVSDLAKYAPDFLDANVLHGAGFRSVLVVPLRAGNRPLGTLNFVSRQPNAFHVSQVEAIEPVVEIMAVAILAQQLQMALGRHRTMETMTELMLATANEMTGAIQTIVGRCELIQHEHMNPDLQRDVQVIARQAQRIADLLARMRHTTQERLREVTAQVSQSGVPSSPETLDTQDEP